MTKTPNKIAYLDGIRGVAALLVFVHHFCLAFYPAYYSFDMGASNMHGWDVRYGHSIFSMLTNGNFFVHIFFVLSGFVLSRKYYQTGDIQVVVSGAQRRFIRLYVPVAFTLILAYLLLRAHLYYNVPVSHIAHSDWWLGSMWTMPKPADQLWESLRVGVMFHGDNSYDTSLWTMSIELTGSMFVFAFLAFIHNTRNSIIPWCMVLLYCILVRHSILSAFVFGISLNYTEGHVDRMDKRLLACFAALLLAAGIVLGAFPTNNEVKGSLFEHWPASVLHHTAWIHVIGAYFVVLAFVICRPLQRMASIRLFRFLGYISFCLYLLHPLFIGSFGCWLFLRLFPRMGFNHSMLFVFPATMVVTIVLSWLMTRYVDDNGIRLSKYVYDRWFRKTPPAQPVPLDLTDDAVKHEINS